MLTRQKHLFLTLGVLSDAAFASAAWLLCYGVRFRLGLLPYVEAVPPPLAHFARLLPVVIACDLGALMAVGLYSHTAARSPSAEWARLAKGALLAWLALLAGLYYYSRTPYSRVLLFIFLFVNPLALAASRRLVRWALGALRRRAWGIERAAIVGTGRLAQETLHKLQTNPWLGIHVAYLVDEGDQPRQPTLRGVPVRGALPTLLDCLRQEPVDTVFVALPDEKADQMDHVLWALAQLPLSVAVVPNVRRLFTLSASVGEMAGLPLIQLRDTPIQGWSAVAKRAVDVVGSLLLLALFGLPMLVLALLIRRTSRGPALFRQERMGSGGRTFTMLKFRSMPVDAEEATGPVITEADDPRCTRVGAFMRRFALDELPQLLNVLRGEMSLVGPRPERPHFVEQFVDGVPAYMLRHKVKAGLTGWAQINGLRGKCSLRKRLQYDLYYINHWSLAFDLFILALTPFRCFFDPNKR